MNDKDDKIYTSKELNAERKRKGLSEIPAINPCKLGNTTIAQKDKSYSNAFDFYKKLFKKKDGE